MGAIPFRATGNPKLKPIGPPLYGKETKREWASRCGTDEVYLLGPLKPRVFSIHFRIGKKAWGAPFQSHLALNSGEAGGELMDLAEV